CASGRRQLDFDYW
nr:immunoglobulin heavy chain junction region [Macaca mulatta]MOX58684.1 immunoglobulin heavy chain junction region [Macaca mulatta]MOX59217.1 immunoglobulin heavy chain junction region [Macaca mulatta]MOX61202.1 immunoglobulin heavy chain junction region [Macaca mulatta]MOX61217.1 immunoglobulin heavy chain junction region [Macaca mulatta]